MRALTILATGAAILFAGAAAAQPVNQAQRFQDRSPPRPPVIIDRRSPLPTPPERQVNPPRTFQDISPPMQSPTPLSPMAPRVGG
ncbi:MAG TPA: hypothetical protein VKF35_02745 [Hyphomicrobiaceae bacterium]|jgi:hypothetical protein|nr:hypothetical protein [Hyphomicrobiaceae bacterium]